MQTTINPPIVAANLPPQKTFICRIEIVGLLSRSMYDEHPSLAFYHVDASESVFVPPFCSFERAVDIGIRAFAVLEAKEQAKGDDEECDGDFSPGHVVFYDGANNLVFEFDGNRQSAEQKLAFPISPASEHEAMLKDADDLDRDSHREAAWDNFSTAERMRNDSAALRAIVSKARHFGAVVKTEPLRGLEVRAAYSLAVALLRADPSPSRKVIKRMRTIRAAARRLGFFESLNGVTDLPVMFADCPDLKKAWQAGVDEWADVAESGLGQSAHDNYLLL